MGSTQGVTGPNYSSDQTQPSQGNQVKEIKEDNQPKEPKEGILLGRLETSWQGHKIDVRRWL